LFYVHKTLENSWSRAVLLNFLDTDLFERQGKAITNFEHTLPEPLSDLAQQITKDPYTFDFLTQTERYEEKELKQALIGNIERFLMELGKGFAYMGREYRLEVGNEERFIDMLFYHTGLHCYVVIEVKVQKFDPADLGQLGFYVSAVNHILKKDGDNPTIDLLVCKTKDDVVAQYTLEGTNLPLGISEYELSKLYPVDFKSSLPTIDEIEGKLRG
jgi:predicted nuclease of restriction endonuclease-like (RecB) superfamily